MSLRLARSRIAAVLSRLTAHDTRRRPRADAQRFRSLRHEGLEDRCLLAAFVSVTTAPISLWESGTATSIYKFSRTDPDDPDLTTSLTVNFTVGGTATFDTDYTQTGAATFSGIAGTAVFDIGSATAEVRIDPTPDATPEANETVVLSVAAGTGYEIASPSSATMTIYEDQPVQIVTPSISSFNVDPGAPIVFDVNYSTSDVNPRLTGFGVRLYYDSTKVSRDAVGTDLGLGTVYNGLTDVFAGKNEVNNLAANDTGDLDGDPTTNKYVTIAWGDSSGRWPGFYQTPKDVLPQLLYTTNFHAVTGPNAVGTTHFNFTYSSLAGGDYGFQSTPVTVTFNVAEPTAQANGPYSVAEGGSVPLSSAGTTHETQDVNTLTYEWDFNYVAPTFDVDATGQSPIFPAAGLDGGTGSAFDHTVALRVTDALSHPNIDTAIVHVDNAAPTAAIAGPTDTFQGVRGQLRTFTVSATDPATADLANVTYTVTWNDGTPDTTQVSGPGAGTTVSRAFATTGSFTPSVVAQDKDGGVSGSASSAAQAITDFARQGSNYALGGTTGDDTVTVTQSGRARQLAVTLGATNYGTLNLPVGGKLLIFAQGGTDGITVTASASIDRLEFDQTNSSLLRINGAALDTSGFESWTINGLGGSDTLVGPNSSNTWALTSNYTGTINGSTISFNAIERLVGGAGTDTFDFSAASNFTLPFALIDGGGGGGTLDYGDYGRNISLNLATSTAPMVNRYQNINGFTGATGFRSTLRAGNGTNTWLITGVNSGSINGANFTGFADLIGGRGPDSFAVSGLGSTTGAVDGGTGSDVLNFSAYSHPVTVNLSSPGTAIQTDTSAPIASAVRNFRMVVGTRFADTITAGTGPVVLLGGDGDDAFGGGAGRDLIVGGSGVDNLDGGGGDDILFGGKTALFDETTLALDIRTLDAILQQWNRPVSYEARVARLSTLISPASVIDDAVVDTLVGGLGRDWFLTYTLDGVSDQAGNEFVTQLDI